MAQFLITLLGALSVQDTASVSSSGLSCPGAEGCGAEKAKTAQRQGAAATREVSGAGSASD